MKAWKRTYIGAYSHLDPVLCLGVPEIESSDCEIVETGQFLTDAELEERERLVFEAGEENITKFGEQIETFEDYQRRTKEKQDNG